MSETVEREVQIVYSASGLYYAIPEVRREGGIWLSLAKRPLPVPPEWHRPSNLSAAVMRGRDYYRTCTVWPLAAGPVKNLAANDELVRDYADAAWWTPGLEEAWVEIEGLNEAFKNATLLHVCESGAENVAAQHHVDSREKPKPKKSKE